MFSKSYQLFSIGCHLCFQLLLAQQNFSLQCVLRYDFFYKNSSKNNNNKLFFFRLFSFFLLNTVLNIEFLLHFAKGIWLGHSATLIAEISANFAFLQHVLFISGYAKTMSWHQGKYILPRPGKKKDGSWFKLVSTLPWHQVRTHLADKHIYLYGSDTKRSMKSPWAVDGPPQGAIPPAHWLYY